MKNTNTYFIKESLLKILLSKGYVVLERGNNKLSDILTSDEKNKQIAMIADSFASIGFGFDDEGIAKLKELNTFEFKQFYNYNFDLLKEAVGANKDMSIVFYNNFPNLENISRMERVLNAYTHYLTVAIKDLTNIDNVYVPEEKSERLEFNEHVITKIIRVLDTKNDINIINKIIFDFLKNSLYSRRAIPETQKDSVRDAFEYYLNMDIDETIDETKIIFNENKILYVKLIMDFKYGCETFTELISTIPNVNFKCLTTFTDYLRLYRAISIDQSLEHFSSTLTDKVHYLSFPRYVRRWFLEKLNQLSINMPEDRVNDDLGRHVDEWIYVLENLHPGDYSKRYSHFYKYTDILRNGHLLTDNHYVEKYIREGDTKNLLNKLKENPGDYARRLHAMLRNSKLNALDILAEKDNLDKVSIPVLIQLYNHFLLEKYPVDNSYRVFVIKSDHGESVHTETDNREPLNSFVLDTVIDLILKSIISRKRDNVIDKFKDQKVYISESLKLYKTPENDRTISSNIRSVPFGSKMKIDTKTFNIVRLFTHWKNIDNNDYWNRVDIDMSAHLISKDFKYIKEISWRTIYGFDKSSDGIEFSGDITDAPNGANEFIDVDVNKIRKDHPESKYILIANNVFSGQPFSSIPECYSGVMLRSNNGETGNIFDARTVKSKFDLSQNSQSNIALVYDIDNGEIIMLDKSGSHFMSGSIAGQNHLYLTSMIRRAVTPGLNMYDLIYGVLKESKIDVVDSKEDATFIIDDSDTADLMPWNQEEISALFM